MNDFIVEHEYGEHVTSSRIDNTYLIIKHKSSGCRLIVAHYGTNITFTLHWCLVFPRNFSFDEVHDVLEEIVKLRAGYYINTLMDLRYEVTIKGWVTQDGTLGKHVEITEGHPKLCL